MSYDPANQSAQARIGVKGQRMCQYGGRWNGARPRGITMSKDDEEKYAAAAEIKTFSLRSAESSWFRRMRATRLRSQ
jgi:hypothetical protein